jgi:hypothetical protein
LTGIVPAAGRLLTAGSAEITMTTDSPQDHPSDEHACVNLYEEFFDETGADICIEE